MHSHQFSRVFLPEKLHAPRDMVVADFLQDKAVFLEIGAGKGRHALDFAKNHPDATLIAIERTKEKFQAFRKSLITDSAYSELKNLYAIHADAIPWVVHGLPANSLNGVFILYPNPEPNNANQRWLNMPFFEFLLSRMKDESSLVLVSNIESYIQEALEQVEKVWQLPVMCHEVETTMKRTHFEQKYLERGETCWEITIRKPKGYITRFDAV